MILLFPPRLCEKYGLGMKVYDSRLVIWDFKEYFAKPAVTIIRPDMVSKWTYKSTMQGTYAGAKVSYTSPDKKHGKSDSGEGHFIWKGTELVIP